MLDLTRKPDRPLVAASILSADFGHMIRDCEDVLGKGADLLHIDVMDGHFVGNLTMGADMIRALRKALPDTLLDVHLMVDHPGMYVEAFAEAGANHFTFHLEVCDPVRAGGADADRLIRRVVDAGMSAGMVVNPLTAATGLEPYLDRLGMALVMSVHPGKSGQAFMPEVLEKAQWLARRLPTGARVEMDGGLSPANAAQAADAGVQVMVTASALFQAEDRAAVIAGFHRAGA